MHIGLGGARLFKINAICTRDSLIIINKILCIKTIMIYDVLIIGAGIEGSAAGYNLVKERPDYYWSR